MMNPVHLFLIEDDKIEVMKMKRVLSQFNKIHTLTEVNDGEEAISLLSEMKNLPDVIFLDLNMPKIDGIEFLRFLKNNETLRYIPAVVLSTSSNPRDIMECYKLGIAGYIVKPLKYEEYDRKISYAIKYWSMNQFYK